MYQNYLRMWVSRDTKSTEQYDDAMKNGGKEAQAFLEKLPKRDGQAPEVGLWAAPHRQLDMLNGEEIREVSIEIFLKTFPSIITSCSSIFLIPS